jgi:histidyl-tRNA synthetase
LQHIIGQKEFIENTIIFRDMSARNQEYIDQDSLVRRLKRASMATV